MLPIKTERAHQALQSHAGPLSLRERRVLILCDGKRSLEELGLLLGTQAPALIQHLCEQGYLQLPEGTRAVKAAAITSKAPSPITVDIRVQPSRIPTTGPRRSLVAARLYMIGMLELQRHESATTHRLCLQRAGDDSQATLAHLLAALHCLQRIANPSLAQRVQQRLLEVLPEDYLPAMKSLPFAASESAHA